MNTFESALMARLGKGIKDNIIVVNTCAVTAEAERQCRQMIRKLKRENPQAQIVVVGCAVQIHPQVYANMPEVDRVLGNHEKLNSDLLCGQEKCVVGPIDAPFDLPVIHEFEGRNRAFLQIQQGCNHHCTFCVVRLARGPNKGLKPEQVIEQAKAFVQAGFQEIVLTGADVVSYPYGLVEISKRLLDEVPGIQRLRFGSLDPAGLGDDFIDLIKQYPQVMPHFHFSIQSGDDTILKKMGRRHRCHDVLDLIQKIRNVRKNAVFGADFITGFPTETEEQFLNTMDLVREAHLTHLHVFPYSERPETPAVRLEQIQQNIRKERAKRLRELGDSLHAALLKKMVGKKVSVLVEADQSGWTENYLHVILKAKYPVGQIVSVKVMGVEKNDLVA